MEGGEAYAEIGTEGSTGTRLFCLSGRIARPGLYEAPFGDHAARGARDGGRRARRAAAAGDPARRRRRALRHARRARRRDVVRGHPRGRRQHGLRRRDGHRRHGRPARDPDAAGRVLPRRVVRPVRALPGRHRPPGGGARPPRRTAARAGRSSRSTRCWTRSRPRCATRRSAASARPPRTRSSPRCASSTSSRQGGSDEQDTDRRTGAHRRAQAQRRDGRRRARARRSWTSAGGEGIEIPTMCWERTLTPVNACRVCVCEVKGVAHARAVVRAQGRGRAWRSRRTPTA